MIQLTRKTRIRSDRAVLHRCFPKCFTKQGSQHEKRPLKIGIHDDLIAAVIHCADDTIMSTERKKEALRDYCWGPKYQRALRDIKTRIDLSGMAAGTVTEAYAIRATAILGNIESKHTPPVSKAA